MILLPTRQRLVRRRDALYEHLESIVQHASIHQVEDIVRKINVINLKLRTYFIREHEPKEVFNEEEEEDDIKKKNPFTLQSII